MAKHPKAGNSGYEAGQGRTFTPSIGAEWTDEFNSLMNSLNKSRNEMTEDLIREGLKARKGKETGLTTFYSEAEIEFLKNPVIQKLIKDYYLLMNGVSASAVLYDPPAERSAPATPSNKEMSHERNKSSADNLSVATSEKTVDRSSEASKQHVDLIKSDDTDADDQMDLLKQAAAELQKMGLKKP
ncbi:hypothetical protein ACFQI7_27610 [Paenibacillus allorhizosphaerae]|uniref:Uncharacterized protein n=1 Tax=Paenibacillus allorhizosphaerae TaxID=2849866 RepID=A0ABM8VN97_9BACL|nr:hypothetical protein [Paenibacillus allorhizosphaerae]CAG7651181.1 hypothetical protein PAECIP111802_04898 [Paenibacillus allorhizosphaerae]